MPDLSKLPQQMIDSLVMVAAVTLCACLGLIVLGFVVYLIVHDGATPSLVFDALKTIATTLLMCLTGLVSVPHIAAVFIARSQGSGKAPTTPTPTETPPHEDNPLLALRG